MNYISYFCINNRADNSEFGENEVTLRCIIKAALKIFVLVMADSFVTANLFVGMSVSSCRIKNTAISNIDMSPCYVGNIAWKIIDDRLSGIRNAVHHEKSKYICA